MFPIIHDVEYTLIFTAAMLALIIAVFDRSVCHLNLHCYFLRCIYSSVYTPIRLGRTLSWV